MVGLVVAAVVVGDALADGVAVELVLDVTSGARSEAVAGTGAEVAPIATRVAIEPMTETGRTIRHGSRGEVDVLDLPRGSPLNHKERAIQRLTGHASMTRIPTITPARSHRRCPGYPLANKIANAIAVTHAPIR